jgi:hypothetical protein
VTQVECIAPATGTAEIEAVLAELEAAPRRAPFSEDAMLFCEEFSRRLFRHPPARLYPELHVLAYWLRRSSVRRLAATFESEQPAGTIRAPRGLAFHIPPTNVDTMAMYSLAISVLVGNRNLVRLSSSRGEEAEILVSVLRDVLAEPELGGIRAGTAVVGYGHEPEPTRLASAACDVRVVWGGDATVNRIREFPLPPLSREITFGDRFGFAAIATAAWHAADDETRERVAKGMYDDAYWFDQLGCSSPRLLAWCGEADSGDASRDLFQRLKRIIGERGYRLDPSAAMAKLTYTYGAAIDRPLRDVRRDGNELTAATLASLENFDRTHPGAGFFFEVSVDRLADLAGFVRRKDQTLTAFGIPADELREFVAASADRSVDRIVPFGQALSFDRLWDGMDLLSELTRLVVISTEPGPTEAAGP